MNFAIIRADTKGRADGHPCRRLNHAVLYVRDATKAAEFYGRVFGFDVVEERVRRSCRVHARIERRQPPRPGIVLRRPGRATARGSVGLYHLAWEVPTLDDLAAAETLSAERALSGASDQRQQIAYGADPDGNEFEIMWASRARRGASSRTRRGHAAGPRGRGEAVGRGGAGRA